MGHGSAYGRPRAQIPLDRARPAQNLANIRPGSSEPRSASIPGRFVSLNRLARAWVDVGTTESGLEIARVPAEYYPHGYSLRNGWLGRSAEQGRRVQ
jgi:hypothetical protein